MRRSWIVVAASLVLLALAHYAAFAATEAGAELKVVTDRPDALYHTGDDVQFKVSLNNAGQPIAGKASYVLDLDGAKVLGQGTVALDDGAGTVRGKLDQPGFLRCRVTYAAGKQNVTATASAGVDPLKILPSLSVPDDFDAFWAEQKKKLSAVRGTPVLTPATYTDKTVACFDVQVPCLGKPVSGYFARPVGARPASLPAILHVHGAGVRSAQLGTAAGWAKLGTLSLDINAHGIPNGKPDDYYKDLAAGELKDYRAAGRDNREKCYFLGMFLRLVRALDFLTSQPEWDGVVLAVEGASQGGGQSIAAAGLDGRVTFFAAGVPAICDHSGQAIGRINGWPKLVPNDAAGKPDPTVLQAARYFDCMNFATRTKAEALVSVGFIDATCPPSSVYATYNNLGGTKRIINQPLMTHAQPPTIAAEFRAAFLEHVKRMHEAQRKKAA